MTFQGLFFFFCPQLSPDQIVLLLECLLEQKALSPQTLQRLQQTYRLQEQDAEVTIEPMCSTGGKRDELTAGFNMMPCASQGRVFQKQVLSSCLLQYSPAPGDHFVFVTVGGLGVPSYE